MTDSKNIEYCFPYQTISENPKIPKAPIIYLKLKEILSPFKETTYYPALIDTGADATLVPLSILTNLNLQRLPVDPLNLPQGFENKILAYTRYRIKVSFNDDNYYGLKVWGLVRTSNQNLIIIGRDFLNNRFTVIFDGKELTTIIKPIQ